MSALTSDVELPHAVLDIMAKHLRIKGRVNIDARIVDASLERSIAAASTLSIMVDDGDRELLRSGLLGVAQLGFGPVAQSQIVPVDIEIDGLWYRLVQVQKAQNTLTLVFEDRIVSLLRMQTAPRKASRSNMTRAEFVLSLLREIKVGGPYPFICPELHEVQAIAPIKTKSQKVTSIQRAQTVFYGITPDAKLTVKGKRATYEQLKNGERVLDVAHSLNAGPTATLALIEACIAKSGMRNPSGGPAGPAGPIGPGQTPNEGGILLILSTTAAALGIDEQDIEACVNAFLTLGFSGKGGAVTLAAKHPTESAGWVAQQAHGSGQASSYDEHKAEAQQWIANYNGGSSTGAATTPTTSQKTKIVPYFFQRGGTSGKKVEDSWTCMQRLASEVQWRCFCADGAIYFVSDERLLAQKPDALITEYEQGVDNVDFQIDNGKAKSDVTITARTALHGFPPGACIELFDCGPADGRWLVSDHQRGIFDPLATITLTRAVKALREPAPTTKTVTATAKAAAGPGGTPPSDLSSAVAKCYQQAQLIAQKRYPYVWGGGHARCGYPDAGQPGGPHYGSVGYDCSAVTCAVLAAGALGFHKGGPTMGSTLLEGWGQPGKGKTLTVYANASHAFLVFESSKGIEVFSTSGASGGEFLTTSQWPYDVRGEFIARHWAGT